MMQVTYSGMLDPRAFAVRHDGLVIVNDGEYSLRHGGQSREVVRAKIERLKDWLISQPGQVDLPVENEFIDGMYLRKLLIPKGTILVGKIHKRPCMNIVAAGEITVLTEFGVKRLHAGFTGPSGAGMQKVGLTHQDTVFVNVFRVAEKDIAAIEAEIAGERHEEELLCL